MSSTEQNNAETNSVKVTIKLPQTVNQHINKKKGQNLKDNEFVFQFDRNSKVQTVLDILGYAPSTKYFTNINLKTSKTTLTSEETLAQVIDHEKTNELKLYVELKPYNAREIIRHLLTLRDFIGFSSETADGISEFAISTGSKFSNIQFREVKEKAEKVEEVIREGETQRKNVLYVSQEEKDDFAKAVREIFEASKESSLKKSLSSNTNVVTPCVNSLNLSAYNPVPAFYKTKGHLLYLHVVSLEGESFHVTATPSGFYINKSSSNKFDPSMKIIENMTSKDAIQYSLYDLISSHSKKFHFHVETMEKKLEGLQSVEYVKPLTTFLHKPWLIPAIPSNNGDYSRLQVESLEYETERNFNDEFQAIHELPTPTIQESIQAEKLLGRISHEFTIAATKGAMSILYGELVALNPEQTDDQIFLKDNIFYSYVTDFTGTYAGRGGDDAALAASNQDLKTLRILKNFQLKNIHFLLTTIVDFGGKRILAQTPVPGLLSNMGTEVVKDTDTGEESIQEKKSEVVVKCGFDDNSSKVKSDEKFNKIIQEELSNVLHLKTHDIEGATITFASQSKGIVGSDKRNYILDLANTYPLDIQFAKENFDSADEAARYSHRQTLLRPELVDKWWNYKVEKADVSIQKAYEENMFSYNPDAYQVEGVKDSNVEEMSRYLHDEVLPSVVEEYASGNISVPYDGEHLINTMHENGINTRYLGKIAHLAKSRLAEQEIEHENKLKEIVIGNKDYEDWEGSYLKKIEKMIIERQEKVNKLIQEGKDVPKELSDELKLDDNDIRKPTDEKPVVVSTDELIPLINIAELEMFARSLKHVIRNYSRSLPINVVPSLVGYFLNLLFGSKYNESPEPEHIDDFYPVSSFEFSKITRDQLLEQVSKEASLRFRYNLKSGYLDMYLDTPFLALRAIARKVGIQLLNKDYFFTKDDFEEYKLAQDKKIRNKLIAPTTTFSVADFTLIPIVKGLDYSSVLSNEKWAEGSMNLFKDQNTALTLFAQSIAILEEVNSVLHADVAERYLKLSTVYSKLGLTPESVVFCRKACAIYERVCGIDSFEMLRALSNLALLEFSNKSPYNSALVFKRIIETIESLNMTEKFHHPAVINAFNQLEQMSLGVEDTKLTIEVCKQYRTLIFAMGGNETLAYATLESRLGNLYASLSDFANAMEHISKTPKIFTKELGTNHQITAQSRQWVNGLSNLIKDAQNKKKLAAEQSSVNSGTAKKLNHSKKNDAQNPELAEKSVDELLDFIEGSNESSKKSKSKSKKNSGKK